MKTSILLRTYLAHFLEWLMFPTEFLEKMETRFIFYNFFFQKIVPHMR